MFLLDTDHISILQWQTQPEFARLSQRMGLHPASAFYFSIVSFQEQTLGANAHVSQARTAMQVMSGYRIFQRVLTAFAGAQVLPFDQAASVLFDTLRKQRIRIGTMDLRIAATALSRDMTVLTRNVSDFGLVPGLKVEDWTV
jgi:tRNA(fMet)-specific endonuclease VapC